MFRASSAIAMVDAPGLASGLRTKHPDNRELGFGAFHATILHARFEPQLQTLFTLFNATLHPMAQRGKALQTSPMFDATS